MLWRRAPYIHSDRSINICKHRCFGIYKMLQKTQSMHKCLPVKPITFSKVFRKCLGYTGSKLFMFVWLSNPAFPRTKTSDSFFPYMLYKVYMQFMLLQISKLWTSKIHNEIVENQCPSFCVKALACIRVVRTSVLPMWSHIFCNILD